jgi:hypothetical protein
LPLVVSNYDNNGNAICSLMDPIRSERRIAITAI